MTFGVIVRDTRPFSKQEDGCPKGRLHTASPQGYSSWFAWAEQKSKRHRQVKCPGCGKFKIWKRKPTPKGQDT